MFRRHEGVRQNHPAALKPVVSDGGLIAEGNFVATVGGIVPDSDGIAAGHSQQIRRSAACFGPVDVAASVSEWTSNHSLTLAATECSRPSRSLSRNNSVESRELRVENKTRR